MRRARLILISLLLVLVVPVAAASADKDGPMAADKSAAVAASIEAARAVGVTDTHATLQARVVPGVKDAIAAFEYGPTTEYGATAAAQPSKLPESGANASASIADLAPATTYHFRVVLTVGADTVPGADATFTTAPTPAAQGGNGEQGGDAAGHGDDKGHGNGKGKGKGKGKHKTEELEPVEAPEQPVLGESVAIGPRAGSVRVRSPHGRGFVELTEGANVPPGSVIDATSGTVAMTSALDSHGHVQTAEFTGGKFLVRQSKAGDGLVDIYLRGSIGRCKAKAATAQLASTKGKPGRRLWGRDRNGKFRTHGADSVAAVRGTHWLTEDTCAGTRTRVTEGAVSVRDLGRKRTVTVRAGHSYLARPAR